MDESPSFGDRAAAEARLRDFILNPSDDADVRDARLRDLDLVAGARG